MADHRLGRQTERYQLLMPIGTRRIADGDATELKNRSIIDRVWPVFSGPGD